MVAPELEPVVEDIRAILELEICHRDQGVAKYGLVNALFPIGTAFLEIVAPVEADTAAGRFLDRSGGHGGYMVIFDCDDPERRRAHAQALRIRIANVIEYPDYLGIQLHPRDCRAAMIEFNRTIGGDDIAGSYHPAGPTWRPAVRSHQTKALLETEIETPQPDDLARHWAQILELPVSRSDGDPVIALAHGGTIRFVAVPEGAKEGLGGLKLQLTDVRRACATAKKRGYQLEGNSFHLAGVHFRLEAAQS